MLPSVSDKVSRRKRKMAQKLHMGASGAVKRIGASGRRHTNAAGAGGGAGGTLHKG